jgi:peroxiredoxin
MGAKVMKSADAMESEAATLVANQLIHGPRVSTLRSCIHGLCPVPELFMCMLVVHFALFVYHKTTESMSYTESYMLPLGTTASPFTLPDTVSGNLLSLDQLRSDTATVVMFLCNHCPYVLHVNEEIVRLVDDYQSKGVAFIGISSNDAEAYPQDGPDKMKEHAEQVGYLFPYLYDESQEVARAYDAACTPDFYVFDKDLKLVYRGRLDDSRPKNTNPLTGRDLRNAIDAVLAGKEVSETQYPSGGCNIKWKP